MTPSSIFNKQTCRAALLAMAALMVCGSFVQAQITVPASMAVAPAATVPGTGLNASWFFDPNNITRAYSNLSNSQLFIQIEPPYGTFTASLLFWNAGDSTDINDFLNSEFGHDARTL